MAFIGRQRELDVLQDALRQAVGGRGSMFLINGEAGIGKSRLLAELGHLSRHGRAVVHRSRALEESAALDVWAQVIRSCIRSFGLDCVVSAVGAHVPILSRVVPELDVGSTVARGSDGAHDRFVLFSAVTTLLRNLSRNTAHLFLIDDLHLADPESHHLLRFLLREVGSMRVLFVAAARSAVDNPGGESRQGLDELAGDCRRIVLQGLEPSDVEHFLGEEDDLPGDLAGELWRLTTGHPLFLREALALLRSRGELPENPIDLPLPKTVLAVLRERLAALSEPCRRVLTDAAVLGQEFDHSVIAELEGEAVTRESLDEAARTGVVRAGSADGWEFSHMLLREMLLEATPEGQLRSVHRRAAAVLERSGAGPAELARHLFAAGAPGLAHRAAICALEAGREASTRLSWEKAAEFFRQALEGLARTNVVDPKLRAEIQIELGWTEHALGRAAETRRIFDEAAASARAADDPVLLARAAVGVATPVAGAGLAFRFGFLGTDETLVGLLEEAEAGLPTEHAPLRARLLALLAAALYWLPGAARRREAVVEESITLARRADEPLPLFQALGCRRFLRWNVDLPRQRLPATEEMLRIARRTSDPEVSSVAHLYRFVDLLELGEGHSARAELLRLERLARELGQPRLLGHAATAGALLALLEGRFGDVEPLATEALEQNGEAGNELAPMIHASQRAQLLWERGRFRELRDLWEPAVSSSGILDALRGPTVALVRLETGQVEEARSILRELAVDDFAALPRDVNFLAWLRHLADVAARTGDVRSGRILYEMLLPRAEQTIVAGIPLAVWFGPVALLLGQLARSFGDLDEALRHLDGARRTCVRMDALPMLARVETERGRALWAKGPTGDRHLAAEAAGEATAIARRLGMEAVLSDALALLDETEGSGTVVVKSGVFRLDGSSWTLGLDGETVLLEDRKGLHHIARLLEHPGKPVSPVDLLAGSGNGRPSITPEAARLRVTKAIATGLRRIRRTHPALARHLAVAIRTGRSCSYSPDPRVSVEWRL